jgi:hypothetical protein
MANYTKVTNFATKDALTTGDPAKIVRGTEINTEFDNIAVAVATKQDALSPAAGVAAFIAAPTSANLAAAVTDETGTGALVFANSPTLVTPALGTPSAAVLTNATGLPVATGVTGLGTGVATALAVNVGSTGAAVVNGGALGTPSAGNVSNCTVDGTNAVGFRTIPQNSQSAAYTLVLADSGKHILHPSADTTARTFTIPANASVAFPIGTAVTFVNQNSAGVVTIAITSDTMRLAGAGTTGSRTLAANGVATAIKLTATEWIISGVGLT